MTALLGDGPMRMLMVVFLVVCALFLVIALAILYRSQAPKVPPHHRKYVLRRTPSPAGPLGMTDAALARVLLEIHDEQEHPKDIESEGV